MPIMPGGDALPWPYNLNACSTAVMHSSMFSNDATSCRLSSRVPSLFTTHLLGSERNKPIQIRAWFGFDRVSTFTEDARAGNPFQGCSPPLKTYNRTFSQPHDRSVILFEELTNSFVASLSHMG